MNRPIANKSIPMSIHIIKHKDIVDILAEMKRRNLSYSVVVRELLREFRDNGYQHDYYNSDEEGLL